MDRRLDDPARRNAAWRELAHGRGRPEIRPRPIVAGVRVEHDVRHPPVAPLRAEEMLELTERAVGIAMREADRDEGGVPAPLVRIQARRGFGPAADVVPGENRERLVA